MTKRQELSQKIDQLNASNEVVIYSKTYCPYSKATKELFRSKLPSAQVKVVELDREPDGRMMQQLLLAKNGVRTVPNVYVRNQHVGGNDKVQDAYRKGSLPRMLAKDDALEQTQKNDNGKESTDNEQKSSTSSYRKFIENEIKNHQVVIWSKSYCPYCQATKELFSREANNVDVVVHEIDESDTLVDALYLQQELEDMTGQRTVPNVFINGQHVGGNSDVQSMRRTGELRRVLTVHHPSQ